MAHRVRLLGQAVGDGFTGVGMVEVVTRHPWLGEVRRFKAHGGLIATIDIDTTVRPARQNGETDVEVSINVDPATGGAELSRVLDSAVERVQAALADLESIKAFAVAHAPDDLHYSYPEVAAQPLADRLFLEGFSVTSPAQMDVYFDFSDLDQLVVRLDGQGRARDVRAVG